MSDARSAWFRREGLALLTDLYELTMMAGYLRHDRADRWTSFDYFFRNLPPHAGFAVTAGLEPFLDYLENLRFEADDLDYLRSLDLFEEEFLEALSGLRLAVDINAVPEGSLVYPNEPVLQVEGPVFQTQLIESALLNFLNYQTLIATKAARICLAAEGDPVIEFGLRRAHGPDGAVSGSRAAYIGGCVSSSNVLAGKTYGIPVTGTHAHSWVMSFDSELEAFRAFAEHHRGRLVLLVDTYDTIESGVPNAIKVFQELRAQGRQFRPAIRLDSGDLAKLSKIAHQMLVQAGFDDPLIVASNDLEEDLIADLKRQGAKINAWGVGTHLITSHDSPSLGGVYKLAAVREDSGWNPRIKVSSNIEKATDPGRKALVRYYDGAGRPVGDVIALAGESLPESGLIVGKSRVFTHRPLRIGEAERSEALLQPVMQGGRRVLEREAVADIRARAQSQMAALPEEFKRLRNPEIYRVGLSDAAAALKEEMIASVTP
ncbi:MAG: nicotinate phosphoribosyltransferase [Candidatus Hydrogenedens sp.]|nr:nicotinate phosphoribosyltransferase [Candidatus Hydrogenedens sp.]